MKTLFFVDKSINLKKANEIALLALKESEYYYEERIIPPKKGPFYACDQLITQERAKLYWIYEFGNFLPIPMPLYKIRRDGKRVWED